MIDVHFRSLANLTEQGIERGRIAVCAIVNAAALSEVDDRHDERAIRGSLKRQPCRAVKVDEQIGFFGSDAQGRATNVVNPAFASRRVK